MTQRDLKQRDLKLPWYPVPPYRRNELWTAVNVDGELVASFEKRQHCEAACAAVNERDELFSRMQPGPIVRFPA